MIQVKDMSDPKVGEFGDVSGVWPTSLVDLRSYLSGFKGHVGAWVACDVVFTSSWGIALTEL